jgi:exodeoxyribonuclease V alpha subunit
MFSIEYAKQQREAIELALKSPLMVLTGGPGTGKTTVVRGIIHALSDVFDWKLEPVQNQPFPFVLAAPTGRAAKRLSESTGLPASTIHRLLKFDGSSFQVDDTNPLVGKVLIVDEASMIDIFLFRSLLRAVPNGMKILFVGDRDQLPSVGPGQVLADLMATDGIPVVRLDVVHRQASESSILRLAHALNAKQMPDDLLAALPDRRFYTANQETALQAICQMAGAALRKGYSPFDIQVLAPTYRGVCGIDGLNEALQNVFNPKSAAREVKHGNRTYRNGDKVLQLVNNAEENVYNGDIGEITNIFYAKENVDKVDKIYIRFDQTEVEYNRSEWDQFTHAYAITIHKSQGSEFPIVLMPVFFNGGFRSSRNLIYTAVTRAKKSLLLFGDVRALEAATREEEPVRRTKLVERLGGKS